MRKKQSLNLKTQIVIYVFITAIFSMAFISIPYYRYYVNNIQTKTAKEAQIDVNFISDNIDKSLITAKNFSEWICLNDELYKSLKNYNASDSTSVSNLLMKAIFSTQDLVHAITKVS